MPRPVQLPYPPPFQELRTLAAHICISESTIERKVREGTFPAPRKNKCGKNLWVRDEVVAWLKAPDDDEAAKEMERITQNAKRLSHKKRAAER
jgi:predicted DNA-binding transcriptional regulator AlpA